MTHLNQFRVLRSEMRLRIVTQIGDVLGSRSRNQHAQTLHRVCIPIECHSRLIAIEPIRTAGRHDGRINK